MVSEAERRVRSATIAARITPLVILGIFLYVTWAMVSEVIIKQLASTGRNGPAVGVAVVYFLLLIMTLTCYFRLLFLTLFHNPDYVPKGRGFWKAKSIRAAQDYYSGNASRFLSQSGSTRGFTLAKMLEFGGASPAARVDKAKQTVPLPEPTAEDIEILDSWFGKRDAFVCGTNGRPAWCAECWAWKPERAHHCSDAGRCVAKMDHFCPWIGGLVSASTFKFFIQFCSYTALLCLATLLSVVVIMATATTNLNPHHVVVLVFAGLFGLFTSVMAGQSVLYSLINTDSIEWLDRQVTRHTVAAHIPPHIPILAPHTVVTYAGRRFVVVTLPAGFNPFDLGSRRANFREVMGATPAEWFLPFKFSPYLDDPHAWSRLPERRELMSALFDAGLKIEA